MVILSGAPYKNLYHYAKVTKPYFIIINGACLVKGSNDKLD